jgi:hypothetical protein
MCHTEPEGMGATPLALSIRLGVIRCGTRSIANLSSSLHRSYSSHDHLWLTHRDDMCCNSSVPAESVHLTPGQAIDILVAIEQAIVTIDEALGVSPVLADLETARQIIIDELFGDLPDLG